MFVATPFCRRHIVQRAAQGLFFSLGQRHGSVVAVWKTPTYLLFRDTPFVYGWATTSCSPDPVLVSGLAGIKLSELADNCRLR
ncbi:hypothetical protein J1614_009865 [Plenodomus biglobosus]|nr:hypothetical protein J1614_009865 [Plenodomus biglobosus]